MHPALPPVLLALSLLLASASAQAPAAPAPAVYCRVETPAGPAFGLLSGDTVQLLSAAPWDGGLPTGRTLPRAEARWLSPSQPQTVLGLVAAYPAQPGQQPATRSVRWFLKPPGAVAPPFAPVVLPAGLDEIKVEVELVLVVGRQLKNATVEQARAAIFGYTLGNDMVGTVPAWHRLHGEPADLAETALPFGLKIGDGFAPFGPFLHAGADWHNRRCTLTVTAPDGTVKSTHEHNTSDMFFSPEEGLSHLSGLLTLYPGDIIFTGTTASYPAVDGDLVTLEVEGLGRISHRVQAAWTNLTPDRSFSGWIRELLDHSDPSAHWSVRDGVVHVAGKGKPNGILRTAAAYENFEFECEWRWPGEPGNSGCLIHCSTPRHMNVWPHSLEVQLHHQDAGDFIAIGNPIEIFDPAQIPTGNIKSWEVRRRYKLVHGRENAPGEWNHLRVVSAANEVHVFVNGTLVNRGHSPGSPRGAIVLQSEGADIEFRHLRIRPAHGLTPPRAPLPPPQP